jgi:hypothetical protein
MSKMSELSQALDELVACGEGLIRTANAIREIFSAEPEPAAQSEESREEPSQRYTFAEVRKAFSAKSHAGYTEQIRALITRYGADKLSAVKEEDYPALMADLEAIE